MEPEHSNIVAFVGGYYVASGAPFWRSEPGDQNGGCAADDMFCCNDMTTSVCCEAGPNSDCHPPTVYRKDATDRARRVSQLVAKRRMNGGFEIVCHQSQSARTVSRKSMSLSRRTGKRVRKSNGPLPNHELTATGDVRGCPRDEQFGADRRLAVP